jgi:hypothetical protein
LDGTNFILQGENGVNLNFLEGLVDNDGINAMAEGDNTPMDEEYGDMLVYQFLNQDEEAMDKYLNMELNMAIGMDNERWGQVVKCLRGIGGEPIGHAHSNPFFDMREYDVEFMDRTTEKYATNGIADNMYAQVGDEGNMFQLLLEIMDHKKDGMAIDIMDGTVTSANGNVKQAG